MPVATMLCSVRVTLNVWSEAQSNSHFPKLCANSWCMWCSMNMFQLLLYQYLRFMSWLLHLMIFLWKPEINMSKVWTLRSVGFNQKLFGFCIWMIPHVPKRTNITSSVIRSPISHTHHHSHLALLTPICMNAALLCFLSPVYPGCSRSRSHRESGGTRQCYW